MQCFSRKLLDKIATVSPFTLLKRVMVYYVERRDNAVAVGTGPCACPGTLAEDRHKALSLQGDFLAEDRHKALSLQGDSSLFCLCV